MLFRSDGTPPQDREAGTSQSTLSGQGSSNRSFGRALGRKVKAGVSGTTSSVPTSSGNTPSISSRLVPGPRPGPQLSPPQKSRTSADTITYGPVPFPHPHLLRFSYLAILTSVQDDISSTVGRARDSERTGPSGVRRLLLFLEL